MDRGSNNPSPQRNGDQPGSGSIDSLSSRAGSVRACPQKSKREEHSGYVDAYGIEMTPTTAVNPVTRYSSISDTFEDEEHYGSKSDGDDIHGYLQLKNTNDGHFERPSYRRLAVHILLCACAYPAALLIALAANNKSIFWARAIVGLGSGILGIALAFNLQEFAKRHLEASTWATIIHRSNADDVWANAPGITLSDLAAYTRERNSIISAISLLAMRNMPDRTTHHRLKRSYDKRPWSLDILLYLFLIILCSLMSFILGRIIIIDPFIDHQRNFYDERYVWGDLSNNDITAAVAYNQTLQTSSEWTLVPFASLTDYPPSVSFEFNGSTLYFVNTYEEQLRSDLSGIGTFQFNGTVVDARGTKVVQNLTENTAAESEYIQFPRWGIRMTCDLLPDPGTYIIPRSPDTFTYVFVPNSILSGLFANLSLSFPHLDPTNFSNIISQNDTTSIPNSINESDIPVLGKFYDNGVTHSFFSMPVDMGSSGSGWTEIEVVLIRMNTSYAPNGSFPLYVSNSSSASSLGYDAAVCVEVYEPWVVEAYNASGITPSLTRVVGKGSDIPDVNDSPSAGQRRRKISSSLANTPRAINSTGKFTPFVIAHDNSVNQMAKDNGRDFWYQPSPLAVSFTDGSGPNGYTKLSPSRFAAARLAADATNVLPFLAGTGPIVARVYAAQTLSYSKVDMPAMIALVVSLFVLGLVACLCVPRLPLGVPRRGFDLLSWLAVLHEDNVIGQLPILPKGRMSAPERRSTVDDVGDKMGGINVKYKVL